jgi:hypothetical protein
MRQIHINQIPYFVLYIRIMKTISSDPAFIHSVGCLKLVTTKTPVSLQKSLPFVFPSSPPPPTHMVNTHVRWKDHENSFVLQISSVSIPSNFKLLQSISRYLSVPLGTISPSLSIITTSYMLSTHPTTLG